MEFALASRSVDLSDGQVKVRDKVRSLKNKLAGTSSTRKTERRAATRLQAMVRGRTIRRIGGRGADWQQISPRALTDEIEGRCKEATATTSVAGRWEGASGTGLRMWRIEGFRIAQCPEAQHGRLHSRHCYIVLHTHLKCAQPPQSQPDRLESVVHVWVGGRSTRDDYGTAMCMAVELEEELGGSAVQYREVESNESALFCSYFPHGLRYVYGRGGGGTSHPQAAAGMGAAAAPALLRVKGRHPNVSVREVGLKRTNMNSGDVFVLDAHDAVWQWNGREASTDEKAKAAELCRALQVHCLPHHAPASCPLHVCHRTRHFPACNERDECALPQACAAPGSGHAAAPVAERRPIFVLEEGTAEGDGSAAEYRYQSDHGFWRHLPGQRRLLGVAMGSFAIKSAAAGGEDGEVTLRETSVHRVQLNRATGELRLRRAWKGQAPPRNLLRSEGVCLLDLGTELLLWAGRRSPRHDRILALAAAQQYLRQQKRPAVLPITRFSEGSASAVEVHFGPAQRRGGCILS